jgi:hypothetical protein
MLPTSQPRERQPGVVPPAASRERLRFNSFKFDRSASGRCTAEVRLDWLEGRQIIGRSEGHSSPQGDLRTAAEAVLDALASFTDGAIRFELAGVKSLRAFDSNVVIVALAMRGEEGQQRLIGSFLTDNDQVRAAIMATLHATNRVLGNYISSR